MWGWQRFLFGCVGESWSGSGSSWCIWESWSWSGSSAHRDLTLLSVKPGLCAWNQQGSEEDGVGLKASETKEQTVIDMGWDLSQSLSKAGQQEGQVSRKPSQAHVPREMGVMPRSCGAWEVRACEVGLHRL